MSSLNKVTLIGNLTRDPELRYTPSGMALCKFGLAVNRKYKSGDEWKEDATFVDITVWGKQGETASEYLSKGRQVCIDGRLTFSQWETDDGQKRSKLEVTGERVIFLGGGRGQGGQGGQSDSPGGGDGGDRKYEDDVPF
ncbi:MAG: single-stranded DNA-binding protein [Nitrospinota bacterium]|nr:single-stranded DNA-binding protein [Nitrospinota bacterium]